MNYSQYYCQYYYFSILFLQNVFYTMEKKITLIRKNFCGTSQRKPFYINVQYHFRFYYFNSWGYLNYWLFSSANYIIMLPKRKIIDIIYGIFEDMFVNRNKSLFFIAS